MLPKCQIYFPKKAMLNRLVYNILIPPSSFSLQTSFHNAHVIFLPSEPQPYKKFLCNFTISFATVTDILNKDK